MSRATRTLVVLLRGGMQLGIDSMLGLLLLSKLAGGHGCGGVNRSWAPVGSCHYWIGGFAIKVFQATVTATNFVGKYYTSDAKLYQWANVKFQES